jgi:hypothetical protein
MKIKDIVNELNKYDENTEVFVNDEEGHERIDIKVDIIKDKFLLNGRLQTVIRLIGKDKYNRSFIF